MKSTHHEPTQCEDIAAHLKSGRTITQREAERLYGIGRLGARILELKAEGLPIESERIKVKKSNGRTALVARYYLPR